jgi:hypothetical protein
MDGKNATMTENDVCVDENRQEEEKKRKRR